LWVTIVYSFPWENEVVSMSKRFVIFRDKVAVV
jgi:hypothetical protein